jgi:hypothetical protein
MARDEVFTTTSPNGLVVMGIPPRRTNVGTIDVYFMPYDDVRKVATGGSFPNPMLAKEADIDSRYLIGQLPPGRYVVGMVGGFNWVNRMVKRTEAFDIRAGEVTYIGDFDAAPGLVRALGYDLAAARRALAAYSRVTASIQGTMPTMVDNICIIGNFGGC